MADIYIKNNNTYQKLTAEDFGAAPAEHTHTWEDISDDPISLADGGTGRKTIPNNGLVIVEDSQISTIPFQEGILYKKDKNSKPTFGPVPIEFGGSGYSTYEEVTTYYLKTYMSQTLIDPLIVKFPGTIYLIGRLYSNKTGFRFTITLPYAIDTAYKSCKCTAGTITVRCSNNYLFGSSSLGWPWAGTAVGSGQPISSFTTQHTCNIHHFLGLVDICLANGQDQSVPKSGTTLNPGIVGLCPVGIAISNLQLTFTKTTTS